MGKQYLNRSALTIITLLILLTIVWAAHTIISSEITNRIDELNRRIAAFNSLEKPL